MTPRTCFLALTALAASATWAHAGGLFVPGTGTQAMGRAGAFAARADDASALHHNPAGLSRTTGTLLHLDTSFLDFALTFTRDGTYPDVPGQNLPYAGDPYPTVENRARPTVGIGRAQAIPLIAVTTDLGNVIPGLRLGLGVMAPSGYPARRFDDYVFEEPGVPPPPQRYDVVAQEAVAVLPSLGASYALSDRLDVGVRVSWGYVGIDATTHTWALPNHAEWVADDGLFDLSVRDRFVPAFGLGALFRPTPAIELGAAYTSQLQVNARGTGRALLGSHAADLFGDGVLDTIVPIDEGYACAPDGVPDALATCLRMSLPQTATLAARWILRDPDGAERADLELDVVWENWSAASDYEIIVDGRSERTFFPLYTAIVRHGFQDVWSVRLGGSYTLPVADRGVVLRGGVAHDTAAAPLGWQRVDIDGAARTTLALGAAFHTARLRVDLGGGVVLQGDRVVPAACPPGDEGCPDGVPVRERGAPDPLQPIVRPDQQEQSPFNSGTYSSRYLMFGAGVTARF